AWFRNNVQVGTGNIISITPTNGDQISARLTAEGTLPTCLSPTTATSNPVSLTVNPVLIPSVSITSSAATVCSGTGITFTASGTNTGNAPSYTWYRNNTQIGTGTTISLTPNNGDLVKAILTTSGTCISTNPANSNVVQLTVNPRVQATVSISASANPTCSNTGVNYMSNPTNGGSNPSYVWTVNGTPQSGNGPTFNYTPSHNDRIIAQLTVGGTQNNCLSNTTATSNTIIAQVTGTIATGLTILANNATVCQGNTATFTTTASGTGTAPTYAWYVNGNKQNSTTNTFSYTPSTGDQVTATMTPGGNGTTCILGGTATSNGISMTVQANQTGTSSIQTDRTTVCNGEAVTLTATATNMGTTPNFTWYVNGQIQSQGTTFNFIPSDNDIVT
ncbi:MAG: hypothetical protein K2Q22_03825, partial [Cytophagales bacterium]|nr:hypothetical protein [Cytophagales bacterium]